MIARWNLAILIWAIYRLPGSWPPSGWFHQWGHSARVAALIFFGTVLLIHSIIIVLKISYINMLYIYIVILLFFSCSYRLIPYYYGCYCSSYADIWHESQLSPGIHQETLDRYGLVRGNAVLAEAKHEALYEDLARLEHVPWWLRQGMVKMTETETMYVGLNMFCAALMLRCVWLQVVMKIKRMFLPQSTYCS